MKCPNCSQTDGVTLNVDGDICECPTCGRFERRGDVWTLGPLGETGSIAGDDRRRRPGGSECLAAERTDSPAQKSASGAESPQGDPRDGRADADRAGDCDGAPEQGGSCDDRDLFVPVTLRFGRGKPS
jgi:hypothetical protein